MKIKLVKVTRVRALSNYRLDVTFSDNSHGVADISEFVLSGGDVVEPLKDEAFFARVFLETGVPTWPNGCNVDAINLHMTMAAAGLLKVESAAA